MLWHRHADAGRRVASRFTRASDPDDLVQEAYLRIYSAVSRGSGPVGPFRPYLYQSIRNIAITWAARPQADSVELMDDLSDGTDIAESVLEGTVTASAFRSLPARWQEVLWYSEVEGLEPADIGPLLGMKAGAVSALAYRAREGLRRAWLQAHVSSVALPESCRWSAERMGDANRGALGGAARTRFDEHVGGCTRCTILVSEVDEVASRLGLVLVPLLVGVPWATFQTWGATSTAAASGGTVAGGSGSAGTSGVSGTSGSAGASGAGLAVRRGHARRGRHVGLAVAVVAAVAAVSTAAALGGGLLRTSTEAAPQATTAPQGAPASPAAPAEPSTSPESEEPDDTGEAGEVAPEESPSVEPPRSTVPPELDLEDPPEPPLPRPDPAEPLPALPTLPPLAPIPPVVTPTLTPTDPTEPAGPAVPTLTGPPAGTPLTTFPTVSGTADPGVTVVLSTASGDMLTTTVAQDDGTWSTPVCPDASTAPAACLADTDSLTVQAHAHDETADLESAASPGLSWTFDRPTMTEPADGAVIVLPESGDVAVRLDGAAGSTVQVSIDGVPTGRLHTMPQAEDLEWRDVTPGTHTLSVRYVTAGPDGTATAEYGPHRTVTVTVVEPEGAPDAPQPPASPAPGASPVMAVPDSGPSLDDAP